MNLREMLNKIPIPFNKPMTRTNKDNIDRVYENLTEDEFHSLMAGSSGPTTINVEVVYVTSEKQVIVEVQVPRGANIEDGIVLSGLLEQCGDIDININKVGLYGVIKPLSETLTDGDRIEIYRPVTAKE